MLVPKLFPPLFVLALLAAGAAAIDVSACGYLDGEGQTYTLTANLTQTGNTCLLINASGITLDCDGHWLYGPMWGIQLDGNNSVIKDCVFSGMEYAVRVFGQNASIFNNSFYSNSRSISLGFSSNSNVTFNSFRDDADIGVTFLESPNGRVESNVFNGSNIAVEPHTIASIFIFNNTIWSNNKTGLLFQDCGGGTVFSNNISGAYTGIRTHYGALNITGNRLNNNTYGISAWHLDQIISNSINNSAYGVFLSPGGSYFEALNNSINNSVYGINASGTFSQINYNSIINATGAGIWVGGSDNSLGYNAINNTPTAISTYGNRTTIASNRIFNVTTYGVYVNSNWDNVSYNNFSVFTYGIYLVGSSSNISFNYLSVSNHHIYVSGNNNSVFSNIIGPVNQGGGIGLQIGDNGNQVFYNSFSNIGVSGTAYGISLSTPVSNLQIYSNSFSTFSGSARAIYADVTSASNVRIFSNNFTTGDYGIILGGNMNVSSNRFVSVTNGILLTGSRSAISSNVFNANYVGVGILVSYASQNNITGNAFNQSSGSGIIVTNNQPSQGNLISGNLFANHQNSSLLISGSSNLVVSANNFSNNTVAINTSNSSSLNISSNSVQNSTTGIALDGSVNCTAERNSINLTGGGIAVSSYSRQSRNNSITYNSFKDVGTGVSLINADTQNNTVSHNSFDNSTQDAVYCGYAGYNAFSHNSVIRAGDGLHLNSCVYSLVSSNSLNDTAFGIFLWSGTNTTVFNNSLYNMTDTGLWLEHADRTAVQSNSFRKAGYTSTIYANYVDYSEFVQNNFSDTPGVVLGLSNLNNTFFYNSFWKSGLSISSGSNYTNISSNSFNASPISVSGSNGTLISMNSFNNSASRAVMLANTWGTAISRCGIYAGAVGINSSNSNFSLSDTVLSNPAGTELFFAGSNVTVSNLTILRFSNGSVNWGGFFTGLTTDVNNTDLFIGDSIASLDDAQVPDFSGPATVSFYGVGTASPPVYRYSPFSTNRTKVTLDGSPYSPGSSSYDAGSQTFSFSVSSFSSYALGETVETTLSQWASPASPSIPGTLVVFSCNYSNSTGPVTGASVNVSLDGVQHAAAYGPGVYSYSTSSLALGPHYWRCSASKEGYDAQVVAQQVYEIISPPQDYLAFVYPDGSPGCPAIAATSQPNFSVRLVVNGAPACDEAGVKLNLTSSTNATGLYLPTGCAAGIHSFTVNATPAGAYYLAAYSNSTSYSVQPVTCAFQATAGQVKAYPETGLVLVVLAALAATFFLRRGRRSA